MTTVAARTDSSPPLAVEITLDAAITPPLRGIYVGGTGDVFIVNHNGDTIPFYSVPAGGTIRGTFQKVNTSGTTATNLVGYV